MNPSERKSARARFSCAGNDAPIALAIGGRVLAVTVLSVQYRRISALSITPTVPRKVTGLSQSVRSQ